MADMAGSLDSADAPLMVAAVRKKRGPGQRLTLADRYKILVLHRTHPTWSTRQLAEAAGVSHETARLTVIAAGKDAAELMAALAEPMIHEWRKAAERASARGDHRPAKDWLLYAGVLEQLPDAGRGPGPAVVIINHPLPGMPGGEGRILAESVRAEVTGRIGRGGPTDATDAIDVIDTTDVTDTTDATEE
jgi:hypothetical protein